MICKNNHIAIIAPILKNWDMGHDLSGNGRFQWKNRQFFCWVLYQTNMFPYIWSIWFLNLYLTLCWDPFYLIFQLIVQPLKWLHRDLTHIPYHWDNREHPRTACKVVNTLPGTCLQIKSKIWQLACYEGRTNFSVCLSSLSVAPLCFGCRTGIILPPVTHQDSVEFVIFCPAFPSSPPSFSVPLTFQCRPCCS